MLKFSFVTFIALLSGFALWGQAGQGVKVGFTNIGPYAQAGAMQHIYCLVDNYSENQIENVNLLWRLNGGEIQSNVLNYINIAPWTTKMVALPSPMAMGDPGIQTIRFWIGTVNGAVQPAPDTLTINFLNLEETSPRFILFENFTSIGCGTCSSANPMLRQLANKYMKSSFFVAYHTDCYSGNPMCQPVSADVQERKELYSVNYTPYSILGNYYSNNSLSFESTYFESELNRPSPIKIHGNFGVEGSTLSGTVTFEPYTAIATDNLIARIAIIQDVVTFADAPGPNGEKIFYHVLRRVVKVPKPDIELFSSRQPITVNFTEDFTGQNVDMAKFRVAAFVQDTSTLEVLQAFELLNIASSGNPLSLKGSFRVYPNPSLSNEFITIHLPDGLDGTRRVTIQTIQGQIVLQMEGSSNASLLNVSTKNLPEGLYIIRVDGVNFLNAQKLIVR